jgi:hypothetical protein
VSTGSNPRPTAREEGNHLGVWRERRGPTLGGKGHQSPANGIRVAREAPSNTSQRWVTGCSCLVVTAYPDDSRPFDLARGSAEQGVNSFHAGDSPSLQCPAPIVVGHGLLRAMIRLGV